MNARLLSLAILPLGMFAISCSSEADPVVSGGAQFVLKNSLPADNPDLGSCLDTGHYTVAQRGADGQLKLVVDGADDARVRCQVDGSRFSVSVSRAAASFSASGAITGNVSTNADVSVLTPNVASYRTAGGKKCEVTITENGGGRFRGRVKCPILEHSTLSNACATSPDAVIDPDGVDRASTFFSFSNCTGF